jgi:PIN domain nuclease of toxin-antitoxin system
MNILLDTHIAVWAITDDRRLNKTARDYLLDPGNNIYYSAASVLEVDMKTKSRNNNLEFSTDDFIEYCNDAGYIHSPLKGVHITAANKLIWDDGSEEHRDPFDRILLSQAISENMSFMTSDDKIPHFRQNCVISV